MIVLLVLFCTAVVLALIYIAYRVGYQDGYVVAKLEVDEILERVHRV